VSGPTPRLLFDENLSARLVVALGDVYPGSALLSDLGLLGAADRELYARKRSNGESETSEAAG